MFAQSADLAPTGISLARITDGLSNTLLLGERDQRCGAGAWVGVRSSTSHGLGSWYWVAGRVSRKLNDPLPIDGTPQNDTCFEGFSSLHSGGSLFAMADGSVQFLNENIDFNNGGLTESQLKNSYDQIFNVGNPPFNTSALGTYQRLGTRDDGQPTALP